MASYKENDLKMHTKIDTKKKKDCSNLQPDTVD
jgi:hypothetical protein